MPVGIELRDTATGVAKEFIAVVLRLSREPGNFVASPDPDGLRDGCFMVAFCLSMALPFIPRTSFHLPATGARRLSFDRAELDAFDQLSVSSFTWA